ncbi:hypothetical protein CAAN1_10S04478 [[Candida] anglica]|uniref:LCCL domain-containing protein n=1 Tax=[Candida] anglica TaxID=148631 RepID=A0ABP0EEN9_9ASCO
MAPKRGQYYRMDDLSRRNSTDMSRDHHLDAAQSSLPSSSSSSLSMFSVEDTENRSHRRNSNTRISTAMTWQKFSVRRFWTKLWQGPSVARDDFPRPIQIFWRLERLSGLIQQRVGRPVQMAALVLYLALWLSLACSILIPYWTIVPQGPSGDEVYSASCYSEEEFWRGKNAACGMNGELCSGFETDVVIRCPALCDRSWTYSLIPIGDQLIKYRGYFVGGGSLQASSSPKSTLSNPYRLDSYPCGAAVHAGLVSPFFGGCTKLSSSGPQAKFPSALGHYGVDESIPFLSFFPNSFVFKKLVGEYTQCYDPRLFVLAMNILLGVPIVMFASGQVTYWVVSIVGFWTIALATDPPMDVDASDNENFAALISLCMERFLPVCFILYVMWHCSVRRTLSKRDSEVVVVEEQENDNDNDFIDQRERHANGPRRQSTTLTDRPSSLNCLFFFYPLFWLGVLNNITFDRLPVDRLTVSDLVTQPGALLAVGSIVTLIVTCALIQAYSIWLSGPDRFKKYLSIYITFALVIFILANIPGLILRIHHYILALILIPGCATRGRTALAFQGILLGLFLSGASRWGLASIVETVSSLKRDDPQGVLLPPSFLSYNNITGILEWNSTTSIALHGLDGVSLLVNDVERYTGSATSLNLKKLLQGSTLSPFIKKSMKDGFHDKNGDIPIYLRIGRKMLGSSTYGDFSLAAVLKWPSGGFTIPEEGVT